jgi:hypothetical protein
MLAERNERYRNERVVRVRVEETDPKNPFITLEAAVEHVQSAKIALKQALSATSPEYHLDAAEGALSRLFQRLVHLLPGAYASYEGEPTETILEQIDRT